MIIGMLHSVAVVILDKKRGSVVAFKRRDVSVWVIPGGAVEPGEAPEEAALREGEEETGLKLKIVRKVGEYRALRLSKGLTHLYQCEAVGGALQDSAESTGVGYYPLNKLPELFFPIHRTWIEETLLEGPLIQRELNELTYGAFVRFFFRHPIHVTRFAYAKWVSGGCE